MGKNSLKSKYDKMAASIEAANIYDGRGTFDVYKLIMRRSINTIPKDEYDILLRKAFHRMVKKFRILSDEENSKMIKADNQGNYEKAEKHDFNSRALSLMANMFHTYYDIRTGENED